MATSTGLSIDFAAIAGEDSSTPTGAADATLAKVDLNKPLEQFSCRDDLDTAQKLQLKAVSAQLIVGFKKDRTQLSSFGDTSLDDLNRVVTEILKQQGNLRIPEVERITKDMAKTVADFRRKYKDSDPRLLDALQKFADALRGFFKAGNQFFHELYIDSQSAVTRLDGVAAKLVENKAVLDRNVLLCDELYDQNEVALTKLIGIVAIMEQIQEDLSKEAATRKAELDGMPAQKSPERRNKEEELNLLLEMTEEMEVRRSEFVQRLFVAWSTAPQIRNMRKVSNSLSQRLHLLVTLTIPTMKLTIAQWGMLLQMDEAGRAIETVNDAHNDALQDYATAMGESIPKLALLAQQPSTTPATIMALADSVVAQNDGIVMAVREGQRMRAELEDTVVRAMGIINKSGEKRQAEVIQLLAHVRDSKPLELEAAPEIPEVVTEYAQQPQAA